VLVRLAGLLAIVAALLPLGLATRLLAALGASGTSARTGVRVQAWWARASLRVAGVRVKADGLERLPAGGFLVCSNHRGYLDVLVLASRIPGRFVAMHEIRGWPLLGAMARCSGTLFLRREHARDLPGANAAVEATLAAGVPVLLFPEGRAGAGDRLLPLRSPLFEAAARNATPCAAVALSYETPGVPWSTAWTVSWWGGMDLARHATRLLALPRIHARLRLAGVPVVGGERKSLASAMAARIEAALPPLALEPEPPDNPWRGWSPPG